MRKQLLAMGSATALALALSASAPAGAIQLAPGLSVAPEANVIQVRDNKGHGGNSGHVGNSGGNRGHFNASPGPSPRGSVQSHGRPSPRGNFQAQGNFKAHGSPQARGQIQTRELPRGQVQSRDFNKKSDFKKDWSHSDKKDFSRWSGNKPHIVNHGWDRHHRHRFYGAFLIGVPYGYYALTGNPCYDWIYGPQGWGYYWNYDRCPV